MNPFNPFLYCPNCTREWNYEKKVCPGCDFHPNTNWTDTALLENSIALYNKMREVQDD